MFANTDNRLLADSRAFQNVAPRGCWGHREGTEGLKDRKSRHRQLYQVSEQIEGCD